jgi:hypothetical protein
VSAPGWYPDPQASGQQRYFDGTHWGPPAPPAPTAVGERRFTIHYGFVLLAVFSLLGTVIPTIFWFASAANVHTDAGATQAEIDGAQTAGGIMSFFGVGWLIWGGMWTLIWTAFAIQHTLRGRRR